jgi:signal peptidase I
MTSNEHGMPDWATGAQGAGELADGVSSNGSHGYSALADGSASSDASASRSAEPADADTLPGYGAGIPGPEPAGASAGPGSVWSQDPGRSAGAGRGWDADAGRGQDEGAGEGRAGDAGPAESADDAPEGHQEAPRRKRRISTWRELPILIVVALAIALVIKTFVVQPFFIPSSSMEDTLMIGDKVLVNKLIYHFRSIQPGDIIVFNGDGSWNPNPPPSPPASNFLAQAYDDTLRPLFHSIAGLFGTPVGQTDYVKRVIGVPGDRVACCNAQGLVTVNGVPLHEQSYLYPGAAPSQIHFNIVVPPGRLWVMGDNRQVSDDSRLRMSDPGGGTIPENKVIGRAFVIVWPPSRWRILPIPSTFGQPGISKSGSAAAARAQARQSAAAAELLGAKVQPGAPYLPLSVGVAGAVPLTWLQRRTRRRLAGRLRHGRLRHGRLR